MPKLKTDQQELFCQFFCSTNDIQKSYELAGYSTKSIQSASYRLYHRPNIQARINELKLIRKPMLSFNFLEAELYSFYLHLRNIGEHSPALQCLKEINKMNGYADGFKDVEETEANPIELIEGIDWKQMHKAITVSTARDNARFEAMMLDMTHDQYEKAKNNTGRSSESESDPGIEIVPEDSEGK